MLGRTQIFTSERIDRSNILKAISDAMGYHMANQADIQRLYDYYKGFQPILHREKQVRPEINNKIVVNRANQIVSFKVGYLVGEPIQYVSRENKDSDDILLLNGVLVAQNKATKDKELVEWQEICGTAYRMVTDGEPFSIYTLDPRNTFIVYTNNFKKKPALGVTYSVDPDGINHFGCYTKEKYFEIVGDTIVREEINGLGAIPIIEYPANNARLGAFEIVQPILDELNYCESDRADGIEQFIQSLLVFYNCELGQDENGKDITPSYVRAAGALFLKTIGENKADLKEISSQLDQIQVQAFVENLNREWREIVGIPAQGDGNTSDSSNNGAVMYKNGWATAETRAKERELAFIPCEMQFLKIALDICRAKGMFDLLPREIEIKFTRRNYENLLAKVQALTMLLSNDKVAPIDAYTIVGLFSDPELACKNGLEWYESTSNRRTE